MTFKSDRANQKMKRPPIAGCNTKKLHDFHKKLDSPFIAV